MAMATTVNESETIKLIDGTEIQVRPLKISLLREFNKQFSEIATVADDNDKSTDVLMKCVQIALRQYAPEKSEDIKALEDNIDLPTVYKIIEAASGMKLAELANLA
jgi:hypothetical protein